MIHLLTDFTKLYSRQNSIYIEKINDYPMEYSSILAALKDGRDYYLVVRNPTIYSWLTNLSKRYPQNTFVFETIDACTALAQQWGVNIPVNVTNEEIVQTDLLTSDVRPQPGFTFEDTLLAYYYRPHANIEDIPLHEITILIGCSRSTEMESQPWNSIAGANTAIPFRGMEKQGQDE